MGGRAEAPLPKAQPSQGLLPAPKFLTGRVQRLRTPESIPVLGALTQLWTCWLQTEDSLLPPPWLSGGRVSGWLPLLLLVHPKSHMRSLFTKQELGLGSSPLTLLLTRGNISDIYKQVWPGCQPNRAEAQRLERMPVS